MKKTPKIVTGLILALVILFFAFVLLMACRSKKVDKRASYDKTTQTSTSSMKSTKKSHKAKGSSKTSGSSSGSLQASSSDESTNSDPSSDSSVTTTPAQTPSQSTPNQGGDDSQENATTPSNQGGAGYWEATSGTLTLTKDTPVYIEPDKNSSIAYVQPQGDIQWDNYSYANGEYWYSFVQKNRDQEIRFYIAYSDVGH